MKNSTNKFLNTLIVKFASPCNLNCTYCYEYNTGDDSWKRKPKYFTLEKAEELNIRIKDYLKSFSGSKINVIAHGGEPLLMGGLKLDVVYAALTKDISQYLNLSMQTNAVLVNEEIASVLKKYNVKCGVSLDGNKLHNRHRVNHGGKSSFDDVIKGFDILNKYNLVSGILCVTDFETDPIEVVDSLCLLNPKQIDFLHPFTNYDNPKGQSKLGEEYKNWILTAYKYYMNKPEYHNIQIRLFEAALFSHFSSKSNSDWFGGPHGNYLVIETDGNYDILDHLKSLGSIGKSFSNLSMNLSDSSFQMANEKIREVFSACNIKSPPDPCVSCKYVNKCGGGYYPTRYSSKNNSLNNPSVYCDGLYSFFDYLEKSHPVIENKI